MSTPGMTKNISRSAAMTLAKVREQPTLTVQETANFLGLGRNSVYDAIHRGEIPGLHIGSRVLVPVAPLLKLLGFEA